MRYALTDHEWAAIRPMLPNKPRGVPRVNDRRVLRHLSGAAVPTLLAQSNQRRIIRVCLRAIEPVSTPDAKARL
jgi:hypothetical protein